MSFFSDYPLTIITMYHFYYNIIIITAGIVFQGNDSLFTYGDSENFDMFYDPTFTPIYTPNFTNPELESEAEVICGNDVACLFDVATTGSVDIGLSTLSGSQELEEVMKLAVPSKIL